MTHVSELVLIANASDGTISSLRLHRGESPRLEVLTTTEGLTGCGTFEVYVETTPVGDSAIPLTITTPEPKLSLNSTSEEIQQAMLESATKWKSIWMDGTITY